MEGGRERNLAASEALAQRLPRWDALVNSSRLITGPIEAHTRPAHTRPEGFKGED
jgi:hypothetical protein